MIVSHLSPTKIIGMRMLVMHEDQRGEDSLLKKKKPWSKLCDFFVCSGAPLILMTSASGSLSTRVTLAPDNSTIIHWTFYFLRK